MPGRKTPSRRAKATRRAAPSSTPSRPARNPAATRSPRAQPRPLAQHSAILRAFIDHAPVALAMFDRTMRYLAVSRRWLTDYRLGDAPIIGRSHYDVFPELPRAWRTIHKRGLAGEVIRSDEELLTRADGSRQWLRWEVRPWHLPDGRIGGIVIFSEDITSRKDAERNLHDSQRRLRAILETAVDAIITIDQRGIIQSVNPATLRLFGYTEPELVGQNIRILMPAPYREEHDHYLKRYAQTGERRIIGIGREVEARTKDGHVFSVDLAVSEVETGRLFTGMIRDLSERKQAEARIRESDRLASIGTLAAGLGHDMNNVLLPVRAHMNALRAAIQKDPVPSTARNHVEEVRKSVAYLQQLADGLHFLAMDTDTLADDRGGGSTTDLHHWWAQAGALLSKAVPKHVRVETDIPAALPPVNVAAHGLTQAVLNLVVNAGEAIAPSADRAHAGLVRVWADLPPQSDPSQEPCVRLAVTDNGAGMTDEVRRRAFEMFYTTKPRGLGTGLGLALVRKVVERARGRVTVESQLGKGTTVTLWLPLVTSHDQPAHLGPTVALHISDGRAASLISHLLETMGSTVHSELNQPADLLICDGKDDPALASDWKRRNPRASLVLFGLPSAPAAWKALAPVIIHEPEDLHAIRSVLGTAMAALRKG